VRELRNLIERIVILHSQAKIDARHIPPGTGRGGPTSGGAAGAQSRKSATERYGSLQDVREAAERDYILRKLEEASGNVSRAAELLGLERSNLYRKMKALGIAPRE
jgi:two-component system nitrogen regulation response regulator NtrX